MSQLVRVIDRLSMACGIVAAVFIALAVLIVSYMVLIRYLGYSTFWEIEASIYLMVAATFLGSPYTLKTKGHVSVDLLAAVLPAQAQRTLHVVLALLGMAICAYLAVVGWRITWEAFESGERTYSLWRPYVWPLHLMLPVGMALTVLQYLALLASPYEPPTPIGDVR